MKTPAFLFHPKVTLAAAIAAVTAIGAQLTVVLNAKPIFEAVFGITSSQVILSIVGKLDAVCALLVILLTCIVATGRSVVSAVDNNQAATTTVTVSSPVASPAQVEVSNAPIPSVPVVEPPSVPPHILPS
jgi:hypothetical protein